MQSWAGARRCASQQQQRTCAAPEVVEQPVILTHVGADAYQLRPHAHVTEALDLLPERQRGEALALGNLVLCGRERDPGEAGMREGDVREAPVLGVLDHGGELLPRGLGLTVRE